jgi:hypothetical protein
VLSGQLSNGSTSQDASRKRKADWSQHDEHFADDYLNDPGPHAKISTQTKDRRKSQGEY